MSDCCQAVGCNADLRAQRPYCRKKRLCQAHLDAESFMLIKPCDGSASCQKFRFCFQCGRAERLTKFTGTQRSCDQALRRRRMRMRPTGRHSRPGSSGSGSSLGPRAIGVKGRAAGAGRRHRSSGSPGSPQDNPSAISSARSQEHHQPNPEEGGATRAAEVAAVVASLLGPALPEEPALSSPGRPPLALKAEPGRGSPLAPTQEPWALQRHSSSSSIAAPSSPSEASHLSSDTILLPSPSPQLLKMQLLAWQQLGTGAWQLAQPPPDDALQLCLELPAPPPLDLTSLAGLNSSTFGCASPAVPAMLPGAAVMAEVTGKVRAGCSGLKPVSGDARATRYEMLLDALLSDVQDQAAACGLAALELMSCLNDSPLR